MSTGFYNITEKARRSKSVYAIIREQLTVQPALKSDAKRDIHLHTIR